MIISIVVDDEQHSREFLKRTLESRYSDLRVVAVCRNVDEAEKAISEFNPDLVFLDIELGKGQTSFDLLKKRGQLNFDIIFITAYNQYAIQAIKFSAIDYLLKPVDEEELDQAIEKFRLKENKIDSTKIESLLAAWSNPGNQQNKMPLPTMTGYDLVTIADIISCEGVSNQTLLSMVNKDELLISMSLKECEDLLVTYRFFRIHKSHLINLNHVRKYFKGKDGTVVMSNNKSITVSRNFKDKFIERLKVQ
jgi:two-component system LytT family response regulator